MFVELFTFLLRRKQVNEGTKQTCLNSILRNHVWQTQNETHGPRELGKKHLHRAVIHGGVDTVESVPSVGVRKGWTLAVENIGAKRT